MDRPVFYDCDDSELLKEIACKAPLKLKTRKLIGAATGAATGSVIPGVGSVLGALIGYSVAESPWVEQKVRNLVDRLQDTDDTEC
ncbi:MAG: hypothetical protein HQM02_11050 [Magnetococcales bacterium]|nr:hypothetical protein [Magnetococcales bacterium]